MKNERKMKKNENLQCIQIIQTMEKSSNQFINKIITKF